MATGRLFRHERPVKSVLHEDLEAIKRAVNAEADEYLRDIDASAWAEHLAATHRRQLPRLMVEEPELEDLGEVQVDATNMPGVSYGLSEYGHVMRPGRRWRLAIPVEGEIALLQCGPAMGFPAVEADIQGGVVVRTWDWPLVKGGPELAAQAQSLFNQVRDGAERVAREVEAHNESLTGFAEDVIAERRRALAEHAQFMDDMPIPIKRRTDAPASFALPPITRRSTPAERVVSPKPEPVSGPALGEAYEHILDVIRAMGHGMERAPEDFASREEERLRDHLVLILNTHYQGQALAEAFNKSGKTDVLIRVQGENLFIAECKWWSGPAEQGRALDQLFGYTTWRDSRSALIFFVPNRDAAAVVTRSEEALAARAEFLAWEKSHHEHELRCRVRWPDEPDRRATLAVMFFHLPRG